MRDGAEAEFREFVAGRSPALLRTAVSADGDRFAVVDGTGSGLRLREFRLPAAAGAAPTALRSVDIAAPLAVADEPVRPVAYSGDAILLMIGEGAGARTALVGAGEGSALRIEGYTGVVGGAAAAGGGPGGRGAFRVPDEPCTVEIARLATGGGHWQLCREPFVGFSPRGTWVLASDAVGEAVVVRDSSSGRERRRFETPSPWRSAGWETDDSLLVTAVRGDRTVVIRCVVSTGGCADVASFGYVDRIPQPLARYGG